MDRISVATFNVRGLRNRKKRRTIFRHLHVKYRNHIVIMQETHSSSDVEATWQNEWGSNIVFSQGTALKAGVAILLPRSFCGVIHDRHADTEGRIAGVRLQVGNDQVSVLGTYAPAIDVRRKSKVSGKVARCFIRF